MSFKIFQGVVKPRILPQLSPALSLTLLYLVFSISWILWSDWLAVELSGHNAIFFKQIQLVKGISFVVLSGLLLFSFSKKLYAGIKVSALQKEKAAEKFYALNEAITDGVFDYDFTADKAVLNNKAAFFSRAGARILKIFGKPLKAGYTRMMLPNS